MKCKDGKILKNVLWKNFLIFAGVAILYWLLSFFSFDIFSFGENYKISFAEWIPMTASLIFGPVAAFASGLGGVLIEISAGSTDVLHCAFRGIGTFIMGYMPYKLWHTVFCPKDGRVALIESASTLLKYLLVTLVTAITVATFSILAVYFFGSGLFNYELAKEEFLVAAVKFYNSSIFLGILAFHFITSYLGVVPRIPERRYRSIYKINKYIIDYVLILALIITSVTLHIVALTIEPSEFAALRGLFWTITAIVCILVLLPIYRGGMENERTPKVKLSFGVQKQVLTGAGILIFVLAIFHIKDLSSFTQIANNFTTEHALDALFVIARTVTIALITTAVIIFFVEKYITNPVKYISDFSKNYVVNSAGLNPKLNVTHVNNELDELASSINIMTESIEKYSKELQVKAEEEARFAVEMEAAAGIQMSLLPKSIKDSRLDTFAKLIPARKVGGDFYDIAKLSEDKYFICVADVSGKGISAALFMMRAISLMRGGLKMSLSDMMKKLNKELAVNNDTMMFVTAFVGIIDLGENTLKYINAGHNPPLFYKDGEISFIDSEPDFVLGPMEGTQYIERIIEIKEDFKLLLYSDGVTEAISKERQLYGENRLVNCLENMKNSAISECETGSKDLSSEDIVNGLLSSLYEFAKGAEQADDITVLALALR